MNQTSKLLIIFSCVALLCSCNAAQQLQRKQSAALNTVLASKPLLDKAGKQWADLNPCANDTTIVVQGSDTAITYDTVYVQAEEADNYITTAEMPKYDILNSQFANHEQPQKVYVTKTVKIRDTVNKIVVDQRQVRLLQQENSNLNDSLTYLHSVITTYRISEKEIGYSAKLLLFALMHKWWFWLLVIAAVVYFYRHHILSLVTGIVSVKK